jgi:hypothetical protein
MSSCVKLRQLPDTISELAALSSLDLRKCYSFQHLPDSVSQLAALTCLHIGDTPGCSSCLQV